MSSYSYWIETLGCPKNQVDSRSMRSAFLREGFASAKSPQAASFIIINSCSFIKEAQEETIHSIFESLEIKKQKKNKVILVGCFAERFADEIKAEIPGLDMVLGVGRFNDIPNILKDKFKIHPHEVFSNENPKNNTDKPYAYFRLAQGCSRNCSFCIIPKIRGSLTKYNIEAYKKQLKEDHEYRKEIPLREVILVSQDTISQGIHSLEEALHFFSSLEEVKWVRFHYLFPDKRIIKLLDLFERYPKLVSYLDIPFQHVSKKILKKMNRPNQTALFSEILSKFHSVCPKGDVRTSFIIGFPGETQDDVDAIIEFLNTHKIDKLTLFRYSHEKDTDSYQYFEDDVAEDLKIERINYIRDHHLKIRGKSRRKLIGQTESMIVEEIGSNQIVCRRQQDSPEIDEIVMINRDHKINKNREKLSIGNFTNVRLEQPMEYDWVGTII